MASNKNFSWMVKPETLIRLIGAEYDLLKRAGGHVLIKFYLSAAAILLIAILSLISIMYAVELLFHVIAIEIFLSLFLSSLFVLIYIFLINTFSEDARQKSHINLSNIIRTGFVIFIAFLISKPVEIFVFSTSLDIKTERYKQIILSEHIGKINSLFVADQQQLLIRKNYYEAMNGAHLFDEDIKHITSALANMANKQQQLTEASITKINRGGFFTYRIQEVSKMPMAWLVCLIVVILFLLPGYLIYSLTKENKYFNLKKNYDNSIILKAYNSFVAKYHAIFYEKYGIDIVVYTKYADPPFNTILKKPITYSSKTDFYNKYCH